MSGIWGRNCGYWRGATSMRGGYLTSEIWKIVWMESFFLQSSVTDMKIKILWKITSNHLPKIRSLCIHRIWRPMKLPKLWSLLLIKFLRRSCSTIRHVATIRISCTWHRVVTWWSVGIVNAILRVFPFTVLVAHLIIKYNYNVYGVKVNGLGEFSSYRNVSVLIVFAQPFTYRKWKSCTV